jgi:pimeloyl-ACP methyl ester carboxylesterase
MAKTCGYAPVDGLSMYYEIEGDGPPVVYIPPLLGVAGVNAVPGLTRTHQVITVDVQGHGRTADIPERPMSLRQHARDVVGLLRHLQISKADLLGESFGGATAILVALYEPDLVRRVATYGATFGPPEDAHNLEMLRFDEPPIPDSTCFRYQRHNYQQVAPDPDYWPRFWQKGASIEWNGFSPDELSSLKVPLLIVLGDHDFVRLEHAVEAFRRIPGAELAVIPDASHFALSSEPDRVLAVVDYFLAKPETRPPLATAGVGYQPGATR